MKMTQTTQDTVQISFSEKEFCQIVYTLTFADKRVSCTDISLKDSYITVQFGTIGSVTDSLTLQGGLLTVQRTWNLLQEGPFRFQATFQYGESKRDYQMMVPSVWYRENTHGKGSYPSSKIATNWSFLETRMSVPSCMQLFDGEKSLCIATEAATDEQYISSVTNTRNGFIISIPGSEWPYSYQGKKSLVDTSKEALPSLQVTELPYQYKRTFYVANIPISDNLVGYRHFLQSLPFPPQKSPTQLSWDQWFEYKLTRLLNMVRISDTKQAYLIMGEGNGEVQDVYEFTSASFLVKSLQGAYEMALASRYTPSLPCLIQARNRLATLFSLPNDAMLLATIAQKIGTFFLQAEQQPGSFQDCHDLKKNIWGGYLGIGEHDEFRYLVNSRCNGEAMKQYVQLAHILQEYGLDGEPFLDVAKRVARFYCDAQLSNGSLGRWWTTKGKPVDINGTNGAYIASFFTVLYPLLQENDPLKIELFSALNKAYTFYAQLAHEGNFYGDTLDADSCDKEAGVALMEFFLDFYDLEGDKRYVQSAETAANFILLWIWQTDSFLAKDSPLGRAGFQTEGMTSVSVAHHHLDFYGMHIAYDFLRLAEALNSPFFHAQAMKMIRACNQLLCTEDNLLGRDESFVGWQPEQINHTRWEYFDRKEKMEGFYDIDIAWVTVLTLGSYQKITTRFPNLLQEGAHENNN